jgi:hypothetical protein
MTKLGWKMCDENNLNADIPPFKIFGVGGVFVYKWENNEMN